VAAAAADALPAAERAAVLNFLAEAADAAGIHEDATALRREIVETLPLTHEAPAALLTLARRAVEDPETEEEARVLLEKLIVDYPRSALAPQARTELQRLDMH
jgi:TolA-binding protein